MPAKPSQRISLSYNHLDRLIDAGNREAELHWSHYCFAKFRELWIEEWNLRRTRMEPS